VAGPNLRYELTSSRGTQAHRHGAYNGHRRHHRDLQGVSDVAVLKWVRAETSPLPDPAVSAGVATLEVDKM